MPSDSGIHCFYVPSRTFTWTLEYPLVTFLTLRITLDILAGGVDDEFGRCKSWKFRVQVGENDDGRSLRGSR